MLWRTYWTRQARALQCPPHCPCLPSAKMKDASTQQPEFFDLTTLPTPPESPRTPRPPSVQRQSVLTKMQGSTTSYFTSRSGLALALLSAGCSALALSWSLHP